MISWQYSYLDSSKQEVCNIASEFITIHRKVFNISIGVFVRDIVGDAQLSEDLNDVFLSITGPQGTPELYISNYEFTLLAEEKEQVCYSSTTFMYRQKQNRTAKDKMAIYRSRSRA